MEVTTLRLVFFFSFAAIIPRLLANIIEFDEFWKQREKEAWNITLVAYESSPENIINHLNYNVDKVIRKISANQTIEFEDSLTNNTRRYLRGKHKKYTGPCMATNPIDSCWRCKKNWAKNRKILVKCVLGFGHKTSGGSNGDYYLVTDNSDDDVLNPKPGTLRHAVIQKRPLWIIFARSMHIKLSQELIVQSHKTIDGCGADVHISYGCGITLQFVQNVIIHNIHIHHIFPSSGGLIRDSEDHFGFRTVGDGDGISIFGSSNIWLDHISMSESQDGLIDAIQGSTAITISNCHFTHHNDVTHRIYASESEWKNWVWRSEEDLLMNGAVFRTSGPLMPPDLKFNEKDIIKAKPGTYVRTLTRFAGTLNCKKGIKC